MNEPKPVFIRWHDAQSHDGWSTIDAILAERRAEVRTLGFLVAQDEHFYYVANSVNAADNACVMEIPIGCVIEQRGVQL